MDCDRVIYRKAACQSYLTSKVIFERFRICESNSLFRTSNVISLRKVGLLMAFLYGFIEHNPFISNDRR